jgi:hypothetical protein
MTTSKAVKFRTMFGESTVVGFEAPYRIERYESFVADDTFTDKVMAVSADDTSREVRTVGITSERDDRCPCCAANVAHTRNLHVAKLVQVTVKKAS